MVSLQAITGKEVRVRLLVFGYQVCVLVLGYKVGILGWTVYVEIVCFQESRRAVANVAARSEQMCCSIDIICSRELKIIFKSIVVLTCSSLCQ